MSRIARLAVLVVALTSLFAVMSSTAGAVTWHNSGDSTFTATAGAGTLSSTSAGLACPAGGTATGTVAATPAVVPVGAWSAVTGTVTWTGCTLGVSGYAVDCAYTLTASTWTAGTPATTGGSADVTCGVYLAGAKFCHISGSVTGTYSNPVGATKGSLAIATGGSLTVVNGPAGSCPLGNGDTGHLSASTFTVTSGTGGPVITRT